MRPTFRATLLNTAVALVATVAGCGSKAPTNAAAGTTPYVRPARYASTPRHPTSGPDGATPVAQTEALDGDHDDERHASYTQVSSARSVARAFFTAYLAYLYGQLPATDVTGIDRGLRSQLEHGHAITTPAERASLPRIIGLSLSSSGPPISVTAVAVVTTAHGQPSQLTATLEPHRGTWLVVEVSE